MDGLSSSMTPLSCLLSSLELRSGDVLDLLVLPLEVWIELLVLSLYLDLECEECLGML